MIFIIASIVTLLSIFLYFILSYNIILTNKTYTYVTLQSYILFLFHFIIILLYSIIHTRRSMLEHRVSNVLSLYTYLLKKLFNILIFQYFIIILFFVLILFEVNLTLFFKILVCFFIVILIESMLFFLIWAFYRYRWLVVIVYGGTVLLAPLITEAINFLREPWMRSVLMFWNWIVPFQVISGAQNTLLAEGWQQMDVLIINTVYALIYCFVVASICLYIRQLQTRWTPIPFTKGR